MIDNLPTASLQLLPMLLAFLPVTMSTLCFSASIFNFKHLAGIKGYVASTLSTTISFFLLWIWHTNPHSSENLIALGAALLGLALFVGLRFYFTTRTIIETSLLVGVCSVFVQEYEISDNLTTGSLLLLGIYSTYLAYVVIVMVLVRIRIGNSENDEINPHTLIIEPGRADRHYWRDIWNYRELFYVLTWRDISVRYKQTIIGLAWALIRPFLTMIVFTVVFGKLAKLPSEGTAPYALLVFSGLLPWQFFSTALSESSNSLIGNAHLISKVYFPRLIVPTASVVVSFVDFLISFVILVGLMLWYQYLPGWQILSLPIFVLMAFLASLGPGLWIASLNVKYRDFRYIVPFIVQLGLYVSPVGFASTVVPEKWRLLYSLNPVVGVIDGFRWAILGVQSSLYLPSFLISWVVIVFFLWLGVRQFRRMEKSFADLL